MPQPPQSSGGNSNSGNPEKPGSGKRPAVKHVKIPTRIAGLRPPVGSGVTVNTTPTPKPVEPQKRAPGTPLLPPRPMQAPVAMPPRPVLSVAPPPPTTLPANRIPSGTNPKPPSSIHQKSPLLQIGPSKCVECGRVLTRDDIHSGRAEIVNGNLVCSFCQKKGQVARQHSTLPLQMAIGAGVVALIVGVFFPSLLLLGLVIGGGAAVLIGVLGFTLSGRTRAGLALGGTVLIGVSVAAIMAVNAQKETRRANAALAVDVEKVRQLIKEDRGIEAQQALTAFKSSATAKDSKEAGFVSPEAASWADALTQEVDAWYEHAYGAMKPSDKELLLRLIMTYGEKTAAGSRRFSNVKVDDARVSLAAVLPAESMAAAGQGGPNRDPAKEEATRLARFVSDIRPTVRDIDVTLLADTAQRDEVTKVAFTQELLHQLKMPGANTQMLSAPRADAPPDSRGANTATQPGLPPGVAKYQR